MNKSANLTKRANQEAGGRFRCFRNYKKANMTVPIAFVIIGIVLSLAVVIASLILVNQGKRGLSDTGVVARINGAPVELRELEQSMALERTQTLRYFREKYGVEEQEGFWSASYGGEIPLKVLKNNALKKIVPEKIQFILAVQKGIRKSASYTSFLKEFDEENKRRKDAVEKGIVIYGPVQYKERDYFMYVLNNMAVKLKEKLDGKEIDTGDNVLKSLYDPGAYTPVDSINVEMLSVNLTTDREKAYELLQNIRRELDGKKSFEEIKESNPDKSKPEIKYEKTAFNEETLRTDLRERSVLRETAIKLEIGSMSEIIEENGSLYLLRCTERNKQTSQPYEKVRDVIKSKYVNKKYDELINEMTKNAKIEIDHNNWSKVQLK